MSDTTLIIQVRLIERRSTGPKRKPYTIERTLDRRDIGTVPTIEEGERVLDWYERDELVPPEQIEDEYENLQQGGFQ